MPCCEPDAIARKHVYMTVQGIGRQQHSYPSHSMHLVLPPVASAGLTMASMMETAALPGPLRLTRDARDEQAIIADFAGRWRQTAEFVSEDL